MQPGEMLTYQPPDEHIGVTWFVIVSPIVAFLLYAYIVHIWRNPPELIVLAYNALLRQKRNVLYIQALKLENSRLKKKIEEMQDGEEIETIEYEDMTMYEQWQHNKKEALRPKYTREQRQQMKGEALEENTIEL